MPALFPSDRPQGFDALGLPAFMAADNGGGGGGGSAAIAAAEIAPGRIPMQYEQVPFVSDWGPASLELASNHGDVPDVWNKDGSNVWQGRTHTYKPGDVILTYGAAQDGGKPIVDRDGNQLMDRAVSADPAIIAMTYMSADRTRYLNKGTTEAPVIDLTPGDVVDAVKRAPVRLLLGVPEGALIHTLETEKAGKPPIVLQKGQVVAVGVVDEPYVMTAARFLQRNEPDGDRATAVAQAIRTELSS